MEDEKVDSKPLPAEVLAPLRAEVLAPMMNAENSVVIAMSTSSSAVNWFSTVYTHNDSNNNNNNTDQDSLCNEMQGMSVGNNKAPVLQNDWLANFRKKPSIEIKEDQTVFTFIDPVGGNGNAAIVSLSRLSDDRTVIVGLQTFNSACSFLWSTLWIQKYFKNIVSKYTNHIIMVESNYGGNAMADMWMSVALRAAGPNAREYHHVPGKHGILTDRKTMNVGISILTKQLNEDNISFAKDMNYDDSNMQTKNMDALSLSLSRFRNSASRSQDSLLFALIICNVHSTKC